MRPPGVRSAAAVLAIVAGACGDPPVSAPAGRGHAVVTVETLGGDPDIDGYEVVVDGARRQLIFSGTTNRLVGLSAGEHAITLEGVAENCTVAGELPRRIDVAAGDTVGVAFEVSCVPTGIGVTTRTSGSDGPPTYRLVTSGWSTVLPVNGSATIGRLQPGTYVLDLVVQGDHCSVAGGPRLTVDVHARELTPVVFEVTCVPPVRRERIAFVMDSIVGGVAQPWISLVNPDGSGIVRLFPGEAPAWSPDGKTLASSDARCVSYYYFDYLACSGGVVVTDPETAFTLRPPDGHGGYSPDWAPTRDAIAFVRCCNFSYQPNRLWILGLGAVPTTSLALPAAAAIDHPTWSPDGQRLAVACVIEPLNWDICVVSRRGTELVRLTTGRAADVEPAWSPDGTRIAFASGATVAVMTLDTQAVAVLAEGFGPAWSRDGTRLVFARDDGLFTMTADGSNVTRLTTGRHYAPAWRP